MYLLYFNFTEESLNYKKDIIDPDGHHLHLVEGDIGVFDDVAPNEGENENNSNGRKNFSQVNDTYDNDNDDNNSSNGDGQKVSLATFI